MKRIIEKEVEKILNTMNNKRIEVRIDGDIEVKQIIGKLEYDMRSGIITLINRKMNEYIRINLNEAYCTMSNKEKNKIQIKIDGLNNDTIINIEKLLIE